VAVRPRQKNFFPLELLSRLHDLRVVPVFPLCEFRPPRRVRLLRRLGRGDLGGSAAQDSFRGGALEMAKPFIHEDEPPRGVLAKNTGGQLLDHRRRFLLEGCTCDRGSLAWHGNATPKKMFDVLMPGVAASPPPCLAPGP
jgi:hypothetical protein